MFAKTIIDSDEFLDMPLSTQTLYFHLSMRADDDGFINNPKKIMRMIGANQNEMDLLLFKRFILKFNSGVIVIKHWKLHNYIQKDRYKETVYLEEKALLNLKDNNVYTMDTECVQIGDTGKVSIELGKSKSKDNKEGNKSPSRKKFVKPMIDELKEYCEEKNYTVDCEAFLLHYESNGWLVGKNKMKSWKASLGTWNKNSFNKPEKIDNHKRGGRNFEI
jgi:hypothetical protein